MREVGVELDGEARFELSKLGEEANRRVWESQARIENSPDDKLGRRWAKYTKKIWVDHRDPNYARELLQTSGYLELMSKLGLGRHVLMQLPEQRPARSAILSRADMQTLAPFIGALPEKLFCWQTNNLANAMTKGRAIFGAEVGPGGPGLYLSTSRLQDGALGNTLLEASAHKDASFLKLGDPAVEEILERLLPDGPTSDSRSAAIRELCTALGVDGTRDGHEIVVNNAAALGAFAVVEDLATSLVTQLRARALGSKTEQGVRALLASQGSAGIVELQRLMNTGRVSLADLFPTGTVDGGLFAAVPTLEPAFAAFLESLIANSAGLSPGLIENVKAAVEYLRGDLPDALRNKP
jgi:hypothetical protein